MPTNGTQTVGLLGRQIVTDSARDRQETTTTPPTAPGRGQGSGPPGSGPCGSPAVTDDSLQQQRLHPRGQVMSHALDDLQPGTGNMLRGFPTRRDRQQRVVGTVDNQSRHADPGEFLTPITGSDDRQQLLVRSNRIKCATNAALELPAQFRLVCREAWTADHAEQSHQVIDLTPRVIRPRWPAQELSQDGWTAAGDTPVAAG